LEVDVQQGNFKILWLLPQVLILFLVEKWIPPSRSESVEFGKKTKGILGVNKYEDFMFISVTFIEAQLYLEFGLILELVVDLYFGLNGMRYFRLMGVFSMASEFQGYFFAVLSTLLQRGVQKLRSALKGALQRGVNWVGSISHALLCGCRCGRCGGEHVGLLLGFPLEVWIGE
jgi:hypothetical protein